MATALQPARSSHPRTLDLARTEVMGLLSKTPAYRQLPPAAQRELAHNMVNVCTYLAEPEGVRLPTGQAAKAGAKAAPARRKGADPYALSLADAGTSVQQTSTTGPDKFTAQGAREGAAVAGALLEAVNFPDFVSKLIQGVFHSIVHSSIEQMNAYTDLVANVAKTLNQFRDDNVTENQARDHLVDQYPDTFMIDVDTGSDDGPAPRVRLRDGVDEDAALKKVSGLPVEGGPLTSLDDDTVESQLVPAARTQLATSRQQLLATLVLMGINRIVVTDGKISAKVLYDFKAKDNFKSRTSATRFDYGNQYKYASEGDAEQRNDGAQHSMDGTQSSDRDASYYYKGTYKNTAEPVLNLITATQSSTDASLDTKASLAGQVEVNFKSDVVPLDKMADSFQIGMIQNAAKPSNRAGSRASPAGAPQASGNATPSTAPAPAK